MENKKIYIDGVDVSECNAYKDKHCLDKTSIMFTEYNLCSNFPYCYFKQLKRLEQENETFERTNNELRKRFSEDTTKLSAELKELQGKYNGLNANYNSLKAENERLKAEFKRLKESECKICKYFNIGEKYRQTLQEIREIVESEYYAVEPDARYITDKILDLITKAEEECQK